MWSRLCDAPVWVLFIILALGAVALYGVVWLYLANTLIPAVQNASDHELLVLCALLLLWNFFCSVFRK